jgi:hypothetical protein
VVTSSSPISVYKFRTANRRKSCPKNVYKLRTSVGIRLRLRVAQCGRFGPNRSEVPSGSREQPVAEIVPNTQPISLTLVRSLGARPVFPRWTARAVNNPESLPPRQSSAIRLNQGRAEFFPRISSGSRRLSPSTPLPCPNRSRALRGQRSYLRGNTIAPNCQYLPRCWARSCCRSRTLP